MNQKQKIVLNASLLAGHSVLSAAGQGVSTVMSFWVLVESVTARILLPIVHLATQLKEVVVFAIIAKWIFSSHLAISPLT